MWRTADWTYLRFHEGLAEPRPCNAREALSGWIERLAGLWDSTEDVWVYFNNDPRACALRDAVWFAEEAKRAGLRPTRVPELSEIHLG